MHKLGSHEEALECLNKSLEICPDDTYVLEYRDIVLNTLNRDEATLQSCDTNFRP